MDRFLGSKAVGGGVSKVGSARDCQALIPFSRGLLPAPSKLVGPALNTRNTISIGHGHRLSLSDPRFLSTPKGETIGAKGREPSPIGKWSTMVRRACTLPSTSIPPSSFPAISSRCRRNVSIIRIRNAHRNIKLFIKLRKYVDGKRNVKQNEKECTYVQQVLFYENDLRLFKVLFIV